MSVFDSLETMNSRRKKMRRRTFVSVLLAGAATWLGYRWWRQRPQPVPQRQTEFVTRNRDFYTVSISNRYPRVDPAAWSLTLRTTEKEFRWSLDEIRGMGSAEIPKTLACISNPVGGTAIGNAFWQGFPLASILSRQPPTDQPLRVVFRALDGFHSSVPIDLARDPGAYLVHGMNGVPLPREHGFPLRVLLPGKFGMKQPRWLEEIEVTPDRARGYWESRGWSESAEMHLTARIDSAKPDAAGVWIARGIAYGGAAGVGRVEVSLDDGPWKEAHLSSDAHPDAWATWQWSLRPEPGEHLLAVRVFDSRGQAQIEEFSGAFPSGSTGLHRVWFEV